MNSKRQDVATAPAAAVAAVSRGGRAETAPALRGMMRPALVSAVLFMVVTGLGYPLATTGIAQIVMPSKANGSLIEHGGVVVGSEQIGQNFAAARYFSGRPSATLGADPKDASQTVPQPYNAESSGASNLGSTSQTLMDQVKARAAAYRKVNGFAEGAPVPVDAVTASASGLDPDISVANALAQAARVAAARSLTNEQVRALVERQTKPRQFALFGDPRVNVLELNLALDALVAPQKTAAQ
ncbi:MAG TPA: potassium-transporting ATPase subunit KdpC [Pararobbsia sp.]|nr:potassium-transporting ATPase subunit KdpC [Pararobbsia sp.]